jgi:hypothetical protein
MRVRGLVHERQLLDDRAAHRLGVGQRHRAREVGGDPQGRHLGVERAEERGVVAVEVQPGDAEGQDLPVEHEVPALVEQPSLSFFGQERHSLGEAGGAHHQVGPQHGAVAEHCRGSVVSGEQARDGRVPVDGDAPGRDPLEEALGREPDRAADDVLHPTGRNQAELLEAELPHRDRADGVEHPAAQPVARPVQELLEAAQPQVAEQPLAHPRQQQHLEVHEAADFPRHLPEQLARDHVGARGHAADRHRDVAGGLAVPDDEDVPAARLFGIVELRARAQPPAGGGELLNARIRRNRRLAEHSVRDDEPVEALAGLRSPGVADLERPAALADGPRGRDLGAEPQGWFEAELGGVRGEVGLDLGAVRPFRVALGHGEVRERVLRLRALRRHARVAPGPAPHAADVRAPVEHPHLVAGLDQHLRGGETGDAGADDPDPHGYRTSGGSCISMPKSAMIFFISEMSLGPGGMSARAW